MPVKIKLELLRDTLGVNGGRDTDAAFTQHEQDRFVHIVVCLLYTSIYQTNTMNMDTIKEIDVKSVMTKSSLPDVYKRQIF